MRIDEDGRIEPSGVVRNTVAQTLRPKSTYSPDMTDELREVLLRGIRPTRVGLDGKKFAHVMAYDIRAHMNRMFDFLGWSAETLKMELVFEDVQPDMPVMKWNDKEKKKLPTGEVYDAWTVCYRAQVRVVVSCAVYTEWATGDSQNQPSRADAHDNALKTAESQAFKRACVNIGDQFGASLYRKGSLEPLVGMIVGHPVSGAAQVDPSAHLTEPLPMEDERPAYVADPDAPDPRSTNAPLLPAMSIETLREKTEAIKAKR